LISRKITLSADLLYAYGLNGYCEILNIFNVSHSEQYVISIKEKLLAHRYSINF